MVWHQVHHALSRHLMSPPPPLPFSIAPLARARSQYLCGASALGRVSMHALVCRCLENVCRRARERIAEKGRTHQLPSSCPRRSSCTQKRLRCRHTHTDSQRGLRYKTCAQLPEPSSEPMDTHIKRLSLHICMLRARAQERQQPSSARSPP